MDITHDNVCSSMLSCFYSHLLSTGRPISSFIYLQKYSMQGSDTYLSMSADATCRGLVSAQWGPVVMRLYKGKSNFDHVTHSYKFLGIK